MTDDRLGELLRAAMPPTRETARRDVWGELVTRLDRRPHWSTLDLGLAAAAATALLLFPEWIWVLAYHL